ncbi:hypothetical protein D3C79_731530 [compost metagenome]
MLAGAVQGIVITDTPSIKAAMPTPNHALHGVFGFSGGSTYEGGSRCGETPSERCPVGSRQLTGLPRAYR